MGNLFAHRATHSGSLRQVINPVGRENDRYLLQMQQRVEKIAVAWETAEVGN